MNDADRFLQWFLILNYPLLAAIVLSSWGIYRVDRATLSKVNKWIRVGYILLLGLCVFPGSFYLFVFFREACYGQGSGGFSWSHRLLCGHEVVLGMPWWGPVLYSVNVLVLIWSVRRTVKLQEGKLKTFGAPLLYYFVVRIVALLLLESVQNEIPFP
jgi:hypothetical protein